MRHKGGGGVEGKAPGPAAAAQLVRAQVLQSVSLMGPRQTPARELDARCGLMRLGIGPGLRGVRVVHAAARE